MSMSRLGRCVLVVIVLVAATSSAAPTAVQRTPAILQISWSPNGEWLAWSREGDGVHVIRADGSGARQLFVGNGDLSLDWSPRGAQLAVSSDAATRVASPGGRVIELEGHFGDWSPDGSSVLVVRPTGTAPNPWSIWVANAQTGSARYLTDGDLPKWSPTGRQIAFSLILRWNLIFCAETQLFSIAPDGANRRPLAAAPQGYRTQIANNWSPSGARVAFTEEPGINCDDRPARAILAAGDGSLRTHSIGFGWARWLPRGRHLAVQAFSPLGAFRIADPSGRTIARFSPASEYSPSADGRRIVYSEPGRVIRVAGIDGKNRHRLAGGDHPRWSSRNWIAFSAMGSCGGRRVERIFVVRPNGKGRHVLSPCPLPS